MGGEFSFLIHADTTGTHQIRLYVTSPQTIGGMPSQPDDATAGTYNGNQWTAISGVVLQEGPTFNQIASYIPTTDAPVLKGERAGVLFPAPTNVLFGYWTGLVMRRAGGKRPLCRLFAPRMQHVSMEFGDTSFTDTTEKHDDAQHGYNAIGTSQAVYELLPAKKFYMEMRVDAIGATHDAYTCGVAFHQSVQSWHQNQGASMPVVGDTAGQYAYVSNGKTWTDGTQDAGTVTAWAAGDYVGVGIDFTNWQVTHYLNGTLVKTQSIPNDWRRGALWCGCFGVRGESATSLQATYNFRGPFGGRKPSGFTAFDFDNEVT
jgi:hypothetical protein